MKITKLPREQDPKYIAKQKALEGCDKCPYCGEKNSYVHNRICRSIKQGIESCEQHCSFSNSIWEYILDNKSYCKTTFTCHTCGAEWESEPYEV